MPIVPRCQKTTSHLQHISKWKKYNGWFFKICLFHLAYQENERETEKERERDIVSYSDYIITTQIIRKARNMHGTNPISWVIIWCLSAVPEGRSIRIGVVTLGESHQNGKKLCTTLVKSNFFLFCCFLFCFVLLGLVWLFLTLQCASKL